VTFAIAVALLGSRRVGLAESGRRPRRVRDRLERERRAAAGDRLAAGDVFGVRDNGRADRLRGAVELGPV
jgi:hypothetical protein